MTRYILTLLLFIFLISAILISSVLIERFSEEIIYNISTEIDAIISNTETKGEFFTKSHRIWKEKSWLFSLIAPHDKVYSLDIEFEIAKAQLNLKSKEDFHSSLLSIREQIKIICILDALHISRIF